MKRTDPVETLVVACGVVLGWVLLLVGCGNWITH